MTAPRIEIAAVPIDSLQEWPGNYREHDVGAIVESLRRFGQQKPVVVHKETNRIMAGHGLWLGAKAMGWETVDAHLVDLPLEEAEAYLVADNRTQERGRNREDQLGALLSGIAKRGQLRGTGYDGDDVDDLIARIRRGQSAVVKPEIPFSTELLEEHQYVVLYFDNSLDWQSAKTKLGLATVRTPDSTDTYERPGIGRVIRGADVIARLSDA